MRKALVARATGKVLNVIELDAQSTWQPPENQQVLEAQNASPGDTWDGTKFVPAPPTASEIAAQNRSAAFTAATEAIRTNKSGAPWGIILHNLAVSQGWIGGE